MKINVDVDQLREDLLDRAGSAAGVGFPASMLDVMDIEDESPPRAPSPSRTRRPRPPRLRRRRRGLVIAVSLGGAGQLIWDGAILTTPLAG